jgi:hypothetical protein
VGQTAWGYLGLVADKGTAHLVGRCGADEFWTHMAERSSSAMA